MKKKTVSFTIILLSLSVTLAGAQDAKKFSGLFKPEEASSTRVKWNVAEANNEWQLAFSSLFIFYKNFMSSQDNSSCNFHPSCSVFAIQSIQKRGTVIGLLEAFDRLTRCNGLNAEDYPIHQKTRLLHDPVP